MKFKKSIEWVILLIDGFIKIGWIQHVIEKKIIAYTSIIMGTITGLLLMVKKKYCLRAF